MTGQGSVALGQNVMRTIDLVRQNPAYWQPINWQCQACAFELRAADCDQAAMPAIVHYLATGHVHYDPLPQTAEQADKQLT